MVLSQGLVPFEPEMGWTGESWLLSRFLDASKSTVLASVLYTLATLAFVVGGITLMLNGTWWRSLTLGSAGFSSLVLLLFWDGKTEFLVQKGLLGILINVALIIALWLG